jgi:hypothetical protein
MYWYKMQYSLAKMSDLVIKGQALDANLGGLVLGKSHSEGGIYFWVKRGNVYVLEGELEGYEYVMNFGATNYFNKCMDRFHQPELHKHNFKNYKPSKNIKLLNTLKLKEPRFLLFDSGGFSIINKYSTKGYLQTIDEMNKAVTFEEVEEGLAKLVYHSDKNIKVHYYDNYEGYIPMKDS